MGGMTKKGKLLLAGSMLILMTMLMAFPAMAGWESNKKATRVTYTDETGTAVTGLTEISDATYYFNEQGIMQTGWVSTEDGFRCFSAEGKVGRKLGAMYAGGIFQIGKQYYGFDENGIVLTGLQQFGQYYYYLNASEALGVRGRALKNKFANLEDGRRAFFLENGRMAFGKWVKKNKYYIDSTGNLLRNQVAPGGILVNQNGKKVKKLRNEFFKIAGKTYFFKKKKILKNKLFKYKGNYYYVDAEGVRQSGWVEIGGHKYYFRRNGKAVSGTVKVDGTYYSFTKKGRMKSVVNLSSGTKATTGKASILILCGHGQGDSGAVGSNSCGTFYEYQLTREFGRLIYNELKSESSVNVYLFNTNYDMYQQMKNTLGSISYGSGSLQSAIKGNGNLKKKTYNGVRKNSKIPDPYMYDYVLEVHFNATGYASKDPSGNGSKKGTGTYVNSYKSSSMRTIDRKIISALNSCGMTTWGSGVYGSSGLLNARVYQEMGVNYSLLETCFIDDNDDMKFYKNNKKEMAEKVAKAIVKHFD